jgi:hypothetical protein
MISIDRVTPSYESLFRFTINLRATRQDGDKWYDMHDRFVNRKAADRDTGMPYGCPFFLSWYCIQRLMP